MRGILDPLITMNRRILVGGGVLGLVLGTQSLLVLIGGLS